MLNFGNKEFRNLQEQVGKNKEDIATLKQAGMGHEPIPGPQGNQGPVGPQGPQGRQPRIAIGYGPLPQDDSWKAGDIYIVKGNQIAGLNKGDLFQKSDLGVWNRQFNMVGPQGLPGLDGDEVIANPDDESYEALEKISIDGITYEVSGASPEDREWIESVKEYIIQNGNTTEIGGNVEIDGNAQINGSILDSNGDEAIDIGTSDVSIHKNVNIGDIGETENLYVSGNAQFDGNVEVKYPTSNNQAANKKYVDDAIIATINGNY